MEQPAAIDLEKLQYSFQGKLYFVVKPLGRQMDELSRQIGNDLFKPQALFQFVSKT